MEAHVEKSKEDPIPTRKLLMMVNDYVVNSTRFVNRFHAVCEEKLQNVSKKITQTEIMLSILEGKINSVDYVTHMQTTAGTNMAAAEVVPDIPAPAEPQGEQGNHSTALAPADSTPPAEGAPPNSEAEAPPAAAAPANPGTYKYKDHPDFKKYFYLFSIGIPKPALQQQMRVLDLDPDVLERDPDEYTDTPIPEE